jgi:hypothetical protein
MMTKGFGVDRGAKRLYKWMKEYSLPPLRIQISAFAAVAGALCIIVGIYLGWTNGVAIFLSGMSPGPSDWSGWFVLLPQLSGWFIKESITLVAVGMCVALMGRAIRWYMERDPRVLRNVALMVSVAWSRQIMDATSDLLITPTLSYERFIGFVVIGILIAIISVVVIFVAHRRFKEFFGETEKQVEDFEKT